MPVRFVIAPIEDIGALSEAEAKLSGFVDSGYVVLTSVPVMTQQGQAICAVLVNYPRLSAVSREPFVDPDDTQPYKPTKD